MKSAFINLLAGIQRHPTSPPYDWLINICSNAEFRPANNALKGKLKSLKLAGEDLTKHKSAIADADLIKIKFHLMKNKENPQGLQDKVLFDLMFLFGRRGREGLRELRKDSFEFAVDGEGMEYVTLAYNEHDKNHHDLER